MIKRNEIFAKLAFISHFFNQKLPSKHFHPIKYFYNVIFFPYRYKWLIKTQSKHKYSLKSACCTFIAIKIVATLIIVVLYSCLLGGVPSRTHRLRE